jgi:hypothetical protein
MKIQGPDQTQRASGAKKSDKAKSSGGASFGSLLDETSDLGEAAHAAASGAIAHIDVLLAAQGTDDAAGRAARGRMKKRADDVLRQLDKVRLGMLTGTLTVGNLLDIADVVASHRERITDPQLTSILDEIDLRAQIEIAKMRMALDASNSL